MGRTKIEYVVNNRVSFSTKKGILGPGKDISKSDFINPERFDKFLSEGKIILKEDYETPDNNEREQVFLRSPDFLLIEDENKKILDDFISNMTIPENQKKIYTVNKLKDIAYQNYRDVTFFLNNVHFRQPARIPKQALDSTLRKLKYLQDDLNYKPEVQKIIVY